MEEIPGELTKHLDYGVLLPGILLLITPLLAYYFTSTFGKSESTHRVLSFLLSIFAGIAIVYSFGSMKGSFVLLVIDSILLISILIRVTSKLEK